jgi:hypothetical protein
MNHIIINTCSNALIIIILDYYHVLSLGSCLASVFGCALLMAIMYHEEQNNIYK